MHKFAIREDDEFIYRLVGVNIHSGTAEHGHYFSIINTKRGKDEPDPTSEAWGKVSDQTWRAFDDEINRFQSYKDIAGEAFGGDSTGVSDKEYSSMMTSTSG